jgi:Bacterial self-protective colicin-like immunity
MKSLWLKYRGWRERRFLKHWPRRRKMGKERYVTYTAFIWAIWMTTWMSVFFYLDNRLYLQVTFFMFTFSFVSGILFGLMSWSYGEKRYKQLTESDKSLPTDSQRSSCTKHMTYIAHESLYRELMAQFIAGAIPAENFSSRYMAQWRSDRDAEWELINSGQLSKHVADQLELNDILDQAFIACDCYSPEPINEFSINEQQFRAEIAALYELWWGAVQ